MAGEPASVDGDSAAEVLAANVACFGRPAPTFPWLPLRSGGPQPLTVACGNPPAVAVTRRVRTDRGEATAAVAGRAESLLAAAAACCANDHRKVWKLSVDELNEVREKLLATCGSLPPWHRTDDTDDTRDDAALAKGKINGYLKGGVQFRLKSVRSTSVVLVKVQRANAVQPPFRDDDSLHEDPSAEDSD